MIRLCCFSAICLASGVAGEDTEYASGNLPSYHDGDITITGTVQLAGTCNITGSLTIESGGVLTHPRTNDKAKTIDLQIGGGLWVKEGGRVHANQMSSYSGSASRSEFRTPDDLGRYNKYEYRSRSYSSYYRKYTYYYAYHYGGGRIAVQTAALKLDGSIEAMGYYSAAGGTVTIDVAGGAITGSGTINVGVQNGGSSYGSSGFGGRAAVTGYSKIDAHIIQNVTMHGNEGTSSAAGTFFYKPDCKFTGGKPCNGNLVSTSPFKANYVTTVTSSDADAMLDSWELDNTRVVFAGNVTVLGNAVVPENCHLEVQASLEIVIEGNLNIAGSASLASAVTTVAGNLNIAGSVSLASAFAAVTGSLTVEPGGVLEHPVTNDKAKTIDLQIGGGLFVKKGGLIHANRKSTYRGPSGGSSSKGSYGGTCSSCANDLDKNGYGDFRNPDHLGSSYGSNYAGGRITIGIEGNLKLDGAIEAKGYHGGSGGTVNIRVAGGEVEGNGKIDISVQSGGSYGGGGGRAAITGYSQINPAILKNVVMDGSQNKLSGAGTFFYKPDCKTVAGGKPCNGNLVIRSSSFKPNYATHILAPAPDALDSEILIDSLVLDNVKVVIAGNTTIGNNAVVPANCHLEVQASLEIAGNLKIAGYVFVTSTGTTNITESVNIDSGGEVNHQQHAIFNAGDLVIGGTMDFKGSTATVDRDATVTGHGDLKVAASLVIGGNWNVAGTVSLAGFSNVSGNVTIESGGVLSHPRTNDKAKTIDLRIGGGLKVERFGLIQANEMSSFSELSSYGNYGGSYGDTGGYGDFRNPDDLGAYYGGQYAGGRIVVQTAWMKLDGSIEARGFYRGSGGTVNIQVRGGEVSGNGKLDVSVRNGGSSTGGGGGGRAAVTGYSKIHPTILRHVLLYGNHGTLSSPGTFFYKPACDPTFGHDAECHGNLAIRSPAFKPKYYTHVADSGEFNSWEFQNVKVKITGTSEDASVAAVAVSSHTMIHTELVVEQTLRVKSDIAASQSIVVNGDLMVDGHVTVPSDCALEVKKSLTIEGDFRVDGRLTTDSGGRILVGGNVLLSKGQTFNRELIVNGNLGIQSGASVFNELLQVGKTMTVQDGAKITCTYPTFRVGDLLVDGSMEFSGAVATVDRDATVSGVVYHALTDDKAKTVDLRVKGGLWVKSGGRIHANEMSHYRPSGGSYGSAGYGGFPCEECKGGDKNVPYGNFRKPDDLGTYASYTNRDYAGGRIVVQTSWLKLDGSVEAIGFYGSSGGTVNINVLGGEVTGDGKVDVSVRDGGSVYGGGGGRASITGYTHISASVVSNAAMHGNRGSLSGAGTFFYMSRAEHSEYGNLLVKSPFTSKYGTDASSTVGKLCSSDTGNAAMHYTGAISTCETTAERARTLTGCGSCVELGLCDAGQYWNDDLKCEECPAGAECAGSGKVECGHGTFGLGLDTQCEACPEHSWANATGQTSIESCICKAPDYFQHDSKCVVGCPLGWFRDSATRQCNSCDEIADGTPGSAVATVDCAATMEAAAAVDAAEQALAVAGCSRDVVADAEDAACTELRIMLDVAEAEVEAEVEASVKAGEEAAEVLSDGSARGSGEEEKETASKTVAALAALLGILCVGVIVVGALYYRKSQGAGDSRDRPAGRRRSTTNTAAARAPRRGKTTQNPTFHYQNDSAIAGNNASKAPDYTNADEDADEMYGNEDSADEMYGNEDSADDTYGNNATDVNDATYVNDDAGGDLYLAPQSEAQFKVKEATLKKTKAKQGSVPKPAGGAGRAGRGSGVGGGGGYAVPLARYGVMSGSKASPDFNADAYDEVEPAAPGRRRNQGNQETSIVLDSADEDDGEMDI